MSEKTRKKKDGQDAGKKNERMHEDVKDRAENPKDAGTGNDKPHSERDDKDSK